MKVCHLFCVTTAYQAITERVHVKKLIPLCFPAQSITSTIRRRCGFLINFAAQKVAKGMSSQAMDLGTGSFFLSSLLNSTTYIPEMTYE